MVYVKRLSFPFTDQMTTLSTIVVVVVVNFGLPSGCWGENFGGAGMPLFYPTSLARYVNICVAVVQKVTEGENFLRRC